MLLVCNEQSQDKLLTVNISVEHDELTTSFVLSIVCPASVRHVAGSRAELQLQTPGPTIVHTAESRLDRPRT